MSQTFRRRDHAVVIGGSMGGLVAARVLTRHFRRVTLIERDEFPAVGQHRRGVPQGRHTHGLLSSGRDVLEKLFPGLTAQLAAAGAVRGDIVRDTRWFTEGGRLAKGESGIEGLLCTRPLLEGMVRSRVREIPNLEVIEGAMVESLAAETGKDGSRITGLRFRHPNGTVRMLAADLVVDATGRGSRTPEWLTALGYESPRLDSVEIGLAYTTRFFRRQPSHLDGDMAAIIPPTPQGKRGGVMLAQEGGRWTVTLISHFGPAAPEDLEGFREFARSLPSPDIHDVIRDAEPAGEEAAATARLPASRRRRYESLECFPEGLLVFGDAICSFNPIYGQGMSVAALESQVLDECLESGGAGKEEDRTLAARFFNKAARVIDIPWSIAVGNDLRMPETTGRRTAGVRFINWYMARLHRAAHSDPALSSAFLRVANLLADPPALLRPPVIWRVLRGNWGRQWRQPDPHREEGAAPAVAATSPRSTRGDRMRKAEVPARTA